MSGMNGHDGALTVNHEFGASPHIGGPLPGPKAKAMIDRDERLSSPSNTRDYPLVVNRALGAVVEDLDGNRFLDFAAGIAVCSTGHCHPRVIEAIHKQASSLIHICGSDFYYPSMVELIDKLATIVPGDFPKRVLLTNSGTEAVEAAMKLTRNHTKRKWIIAFYGAFHGRTMGSLSLTCSKSRQREHFGPLVPMTTHVPYGDADAIEQSLFQYKMTPDEVAAIFVEALQGEGGYIVPDPAFLKQLRAICDKHGIVLVCDEIQSGAGRTGKWFAFEHAGITPDIVLMAKGMGSGMPIGAVIARENIMDWLPGAQGSTYGGNPVACAAAVATLDLIESGFMANAASLGKVLMSRLNEITEKHAVIGNPRGLGLMCAVDVVDPKTGTGNAAHRDKILKAAFAKGLILLPCGAVSIRFCPPLNLTETELDVGLRLFEQAIVDAG